MIVLGFAFLHEKSEKNNLTRLIPILGSDRGTALIGMYSLEIYLIYECIYLNFNRIYKISDKIGLTYAIACFSTALIFSIILHSVCEVIKRAFE